MKARKVWLYGLLFLALSNSLAVGAQQRLGRLDLDDVVGLLTKAEFDLPSRAGELWQRDDGLPAPEHAEFAGQAARLVNQHPVTPPDDHRSTLWDIDKTASRQLNCLAYPATKRQDCRREVAGLSRRQCGCRGVCPPEPGTAARRTARSPPIHEHLLERWGYRHDDGRVQIELVPSDRSFELRWLEIATSC